MGDFSARMRELIERVGDGILRGEVVVDQIYALRQHEDFSLDHPRGGGPKYLSGPLEESGYDFVADLADVVLDGDLRSTMALCMEDLSTQLDPAAPIDAEPNPIRLRRSGNPRVIDNGALIYDRLPIDPREPPGASGTRYSDRPEQTKRK